MNFLAEYWIETDSPRVVSVVEAESMAPFGAIRMAWGDLFEIDVFPSGDSRPGDGDAQAGDVRPASVKGQLLRWDEPFSGCLGLSLYRSDSVGGSCLAARLDGHAEPSPADTPCCTSPSLPLPPLSHLRNPSPTFYPLPTDWSCAPQVTQTARPA